MRSALLFLLCCLLPLQCLSTIDFCDGDPRVLAVTRTCPLSSRRPKLALYTHAIDSNINHALHDKVWAIAHYLRHCTSNYTVSLTFNQDPFIPKQCTAEELPHRSNIWGRCIAYFSATAAGVHPSRIHFGPVDEKWWAREEEECFDKSVAIGVIPPPERQNGTGITNAYFRRMSWHGRDCTSTLPTVRGQEQHSCAGREIGGGLVGLPTELKKAALRHIRDACMAGVGAVWAREKEERAVRVLVYSRYDTSRRQWLNANDTYETIKDDPRLAVAILDEMPRSFPQQLRLYAWADLVVAPHGAGMANTLFLREGADIVEIWQLCGRRVSWDRYIAKDWTGWHAGLLGLSLQYLQCHCEETGYVGEESLLKGRNGPATDGGHLIRVEDSVEVIESAVLRQVVRAAREAGVDVTGDNLTARLAEEDVDEGSEEGKIRRMRIGGVIVVGVSWLVLLAVRFSTRGKAWHLSGSGT